MVVTATWLQKSGHSKQINLYIYIQILKHRVKQRSYRHIIYDLLLGFSTTSRYHMLVSCFCEKSSKNCLSSTIA